MTTNTLAGGSPVNPHATPAARSIVSLHPGAQQKALTVDVYEPGEVNIALDMPQYQIGETPEGEAVLGGGHRCGAFSVEEAEGFRDALTEAIEFSRMLAATEEP